MNSFPCFTYAFVYTSISCFNFIYGNSCARAMLLFIGCLAPQPMYFKIVVAVELNLKCIYISIIYVTMVIVGWNLYVNVAPVVCILAHRLLLLLLLLLLLSLPFYIKSYSRVASWIDFCM